MKKIYKYTEDFRRMGSLESVFLATEEQVAKLRALGEVHLGEILGKHSEVFATINDKTLVEIPGSEEVVSFIQAHGPFGNADLIGRYRDLVDDGVVEDPEYLAQIQAEREERMRRWDAERAAKDLAAVEKL